MNEISPVVILFQMSVFEHLTQLNTENNKMFIRTNLILTFYDVTIK